MYWLRFVRPRRKYWAFHYELVDQFWEGQSVSESVLADLGIHPTVETAYQFWLRESQQITTDWASLQRSTYAQSMSQFLYQYRDPQVLIVEAEIRKVQECQSQARKRRSQRRRRYRNHSAHEDYYRALGIAPGASKQMIRSAYRRQVQTHHPDKGGKQEEFIRVRRAYEALKNL
jgi:hypothetical protein